MIQQQSTKTFNNNNENVHCAFGGIDEIKSVNELLFSSYTFPYAIDILKQIPENHYILSVQYHDNGTPTDCQPPGITGKVASEETVMYGCIREMIEETGLYPIGHSLNYIPTYGSTSIYHIDADNITFAQYRKQQLGTDKGSRRKIVIIIHGTLDKMLHCLEHVIHFPKNDSIIGAYIIPRNDAINIHQQITWSKPHSKFIYKFKN